jgi:hypothetical protein
MVQQFACRLIPGSLLAGAKYSCISPRGGRGSSVDIKGKNNFDANGNLLHLDNIVVV